MLTGSHGLLIRDREHLNSLSMLAIFKVETMFDYQTSKHAHFDAACRAFAIEHNLEDVAAAVGMRPQILRNKLNPAQPHRLTCDELLAITGYVERAQPAENGFQRLFVRELVGVFERMWPCSFQHPTLRKVASWLEENSGIAVSVPDASYSDKPIPHFTHNGTGYQLLNNLGRAFSIPDYIWYQLPDGSLYVGGVEKAMFAGRPVDIPAEFSQGAAGGNSITLPVIQSLRPGVELNGERVTKVHLTNDTMAVTWTPRNRATGQPLQKTPAQRQIESHYPELASGLHLPKLARVVAPSEAVKSGNFADPFRPRYAVDVQLLDADGNPDNQTPVYSAGPLPVPMAGNDSGMFQFPPEGTLVEVAFTGGRPDKPFIRQTLPDGTSLPDVKPGEQLQQQRAEVSQRVTQAGDWVRQTDQTISETSMARMVKADTE